MKLHQENFIQHWITCISQNNFHPLCQVMFNIFNKYLLIMCQTLARCWKIKSVKYSLWLAQENHILLKKKIVKIQQAITVFEKDYDSRVSQLGVTGDILHCRNWRGSYCPLVGRGLGCRQTCKNEQDNVLTTPPKPQQNQDWETHCRKFLGQS